MTVTSAYGDEGRRRGVGRLPAANNAFAWDLYDAVRSGQDNLFLSPYSVSVALWMTREGARGETAAQMDRVLHLDAKAAMPGSAYPALLATLAAPEVLDGFGRDARKVPAYEIEIANALWGHRGYPFHAAFLERLSDAYGAPLRRVDFTKTDEARRIINTWVEEQTRERIKDIVPAGLPSPVTRLALANAIYFKAQWQHAFSERATSEADFTTAKGSVVRVPLMHKVHRWSYANLETCAAVELPYRGGTTSMIVLLPHAADGLAALEAALTTRRLGGVLTKLAPARVDVKLPRFEFTRALQMGDTLRAMGMEHAFDAARADFSGMTDAEKLYVGAVLHKAFVAVDEHGTEAAAATVVTLKGRSAVGGEKPVRFWADRPFVFVIRHRPTNTILFVGRVTDPTVS